MILIDFIKKKAFVLLGLFLILLYGYVGYFSLGFDDEFANIDWISKYGIGVVDYVQKNDVHPPGSYIVDLLLFTIFGKWSLVRLFISISTSIFLIYAIMSIKNRNGKFAGLVLFLLLGLNPAILLWCTSVRWYAFFVPILIWLCVVPKQQGWQYWGKCFLGLLILGYFSYAVFIVSIPILFLYWTESKETETEKIKSIILFGFLFLLLYSYQLYVFLNVHIIKEGSQRLSLLKNLIGFYIAQVSNQGVFPLSFPGVMSAIASIGVFTTIIYSNFQENILKNKYFASYTLSVLLSVLTGIAGKFRNLVIISPMQALWISSAIINGYKKKIFIFFISILAISNIWGNYNVITHQNTTKNDCNLPIRKILEDICIENKKHTNDVIILCHSRTLYWNLINSGYCVLNPLYKCRLPASFFLSKHKCVIVLKTWHGSMQQKKYNTLYNELKLIKNDSSITTKYGRDDFYVLKQKLDPRYPEYSVEMTKYYEVESLGELKSWLSAKP